DEARFADGLPEAIRTPVSISDLSDITLRWEGKRKKNGRFDPDVCRILFYLQLEHLRETIVDVNIQNRLISIYIFNDSFRLSGLMEQLEPMLREKLKEA